MEQVRLRSVSLSELIGEKIVTALEGMQNCRRQIERAVHRFISRSIFHNLH
jgi:hypothetical protein